MHPAYHHKTTCYRRPTNRAFSLVELSIVLVILGLLVGGILAGQSLIRAAELRSVATEYSRHLTATQSFRDKYFAIPGDMSNATKFWGVADPTPATCITTAGTGTQTCDGNANGQVEYTGSAGSNEMFRFWQHLANAGLIEGSYDGIAHGSNAYSAVIGTNVPRSKLSGAGWGAYYQGVYASITMYSLDYGNLFEFGAAPANNDPLMPILKPEEAWNIDSKLDDGKPASGKIVARFWNNLCSAADDGSSTNNDLVASYRLSDTTVQCPLIFRQAF